MEKKFLDELKWRGLIYQHTPGIEKALERGTTLYLGFDPTGDSLHIGHFVWITFLRRAAMYGNKIIVLAGGGTAMIGDPKGDAERPILPKEVIEENKKKIAVLLDRYFEKGAAQMVDNSEWLEKLTYIDFLRDVGKVMSVNSMLDKESVSARLARKEGISYAEFSYQLLQAYDFLELNEKYSCEVQIGGSDQWGNIVQGVELIRKKTGKEAYALSFPLIVNPKTGKKFGKTEQGAAIWLDPKKTHPFEFYQFFINIDDDMAPNLMRYFSFKTKEEIEAIEKKWEADRASRLLQKELAYELCTLVHGKEVADQVTKITSILFAKGEEQMTKEDLEFIKTALPYKTIASESEMILESVIVEMGLVSSKGEARRLIEQNGVKSEKMFDSYYLIRKGKKEYGVVEVRESR